MENGDTEKYHTSRLIQDFVSSSRKMGCIRCKSSQVYNKHFYTQIFCLFKPKTLYQPVGRIKKEQRHVGRQVMSLVS